MQLSVITPVYQASAYLDNFHARMSKAAQAITDDYEIIYVNDGSTDDSLEKLLALHQTDAHIVIIDLTRNFGQPNAIRTGLSYAKGELVFIIDDDLEEQPEWLFQFHQAILEKKADIVFSAQHKRKGSWIERFSGACFFFFLKKVLRVHFIKNVMTARLMTKAHLQTLLHLKERNASFTALSLWAGCHYHILYLDKASQGATSYSLCKRLRLMVNHITSVSSQPLQWPFLFFAIWITICLLYFFLATLFPHTMGSYYRVLYLDSLLLLGVSLTLLSLGILGLYLRPIFDEVRHRPLAIVRRVYVAGASGQ